jgi:two-component system phosphate regulon sensor histidine kinase PhoR
MKRAKKQIALAVLALVILVGLQTYTVFRIHRLETDKFDNEYKELILNGLNFYDEIQSGLGLRTAHKAMDLQAEFLLNYFSTQDVEDTAGFKSYAIGTMTEEFHNRQKLDKIIQDILYKNGVKTEVEVLLSMEKLTLEGFIDTINIDPEKDAVEVDYLVEKKNLGKYLNVKYMEYYGTHFSCSYVLLVDFDQKRKMILSQIVGILIIMVLAIIIVGLIFALNLRNMLEEQRLSQLKTDFINNMTHELKTPLSTIAIATRSLGNDEFAKDQNKVKDTARMIGRQNKQLSKQINHLLEVSMWERKQFELDKGWFNIHEFMHGLVEAFRWECKECQLTVNEKCEISEELQVFMDETQIATALHNLLINGVKYNDNDPHITVSCRMDDQLIITIQDNGIGISKENAKHIFEKFYRVHTGDIHKVKGLGLGLFYVRQIIEAHQGSISLQSKIGKGSTFTIKLPVNGRTKNTSGRG